jgi:hypothetical protein
MSFKKPFHAEPVKLGPYWRAEQKRTRQRRRLRLARLIVLGSMLVFIVGMTVTNWSSLSATFPVFYWDCASARAAGAAPIDRGAPGYRSGLDADDDGIACEPYNRD